MGMMSNTAQIFEGWDLETEHFCFSINIEVFKGSLHLPNNSLVRLLVSSSGFTAQVTLDSGFEIFQELIADLEAIYQTLDKTKQAILSEPYGDQKLVFSCNSRGYILVKGTLSSNGQGGFYQTLQLENAFLNQELPQLIKSLKQKEQYVLDLVKEN